MQNQKANKTDRDDGKVVGKNDDAAIDREPTGGKNNGAKTESETAPAETSPSASGAVELELDPVEKLRLQLSRAEKANAEIRDQLLRNRAEMENFKRRMLKEKNDAALYANERLIRQLIPVYEDFERALSAPDTNPQSLRQGVEMIFKKFVAFMEKENVKPIAALGCKFDPSLHEALSQAESAEHEENTVIREFSKGFYLQDRVLQPARVVISRKPPAAETENKTAGNSSESDSSPKSDSGKIA
jgi:molecular chaperone GrpE